VNRKIVFVLCIVYLGSILQVAAQDSSGIVFIENKGQFPEVVHYYASIPGGTLFVEDHGLTYNFNDPSQNQNHSSHLENVVRPDSLDYIAVKLEFLGANRTPAFSALEQQPTQYSFFTGSDEKAWIKGARAYKSIKIQDLYNDVDFVLSSTSKGLKYDLVLQPSVDPSCVQIQYKGADRLQLQDGRLEVELPYTSLIEQIPASYAICDDQKRAITTNFTLQDDIVSFKLADAIDVGESVIIDPLLVFSTYSGSPSDNWGNTATFDDKGNAYAGGITTTIRGTNVLPPFPTTPGAYQVESGGGWDVALLKFDSVGQNLLYATYLGGAGTDVPQSLIVDNNGDLLILGVTSSTDFPTTDTAFDREFNGGNETSLIAGVDMPGGSDLFVAKLSRDGTELIGSTYVGGSDNDGVLRSLSDLVRNYGDESRGDINFDSNGNILVASRTSSDNFPLMNPIDPSYNGNTDAVVFSLTPDLSALNFSTFMGGQQTDVALSIKLSPNEEIYLAGGTSSYDFPSTANAYQTVIGGDVDGWVAKISQNGEALLASSFIGTSTYDQTFFMDLDVSGSVYLAGQTLGNYPITTGKFSNGSGGQFIHKLSNDLENSIFSTVINKAGTTQPAISLTAFLVNDCNNIYLSGWGSPRLNVDPTAGYFTLNTFGLPITNDAYQSESDGSSFYLMVLLGDATELLYATHLGNASANVHVDGGTSRFDKNGIVYHSVCASCGGDSTFPTTPAAYSQVNGSSGCNNAVFKFDLASLRAKIQTNNLELSNPGVDLGCEPLTVVFENLSTAGEIYEWDFGDGSMRSVFTKDTLVHVYEKEGTYEVVLRAYDPNTCIAEDFDYTSIEVVNPNFSISSGADICGGTSVQLFATGGDEYLWSPAEGLSDPTIANPVATPQDSTTYSVKVINYSGCEYYDSLTINVVPEILPVISVDEINICEGRRTIRLSSESENTTGITWSLGDGAVSDISEFDYQYEADGTYQVVAKLTNGFCEKSLNFPIEITQIMIPNVLTRNNDGFNDVFKVTSAQPIGLRIYTRWGTQVFEAAEYNNDWSGENLSGGVYFYEALLYNGEICSGWIQLMNE
jgi:gliding motility-associated-like protein